MDGHVLLTGLSGSGKSTVGRLLARRLRRPFVDTDAEIVRRAAKPIDVIFEEDGEDRFRELETEALCEALESEWAVIATGGGALVSDANRQRALQAAIVVWLDVSVETAAARVTTSERRPLVSPDPVAGLQRLLDERRDLYAKAHHRVSADADAGTVVDRIVTAIEGR